MAPPRDDAAALVIRIVDILQGGYTLDIAVSPDSLQLPHGDDTEFSAAVRVKGHLSCTAEQVYFHGFIHSAVTMPCSRCLQPSQIDFTAETRGVFLPASSDLSSAASDGGPGPTDEIDLFVHDGTIVDLRTLVSEQAVLAIPIQALCRAECAGLCHTCGCNLNHEACTCQTDNLDPRFAVLSQLRHPKPS